MSGMRSHGRRRQQSAGNLPGFWVIALCWSELRGPHRQPCWRRLPRHRPGVEILISQLPFVAVPRRVAEQGSGMAEEQPGLHQPFAERLGLCCRQICVALRCDEPANRRPHPLGLEPVAQDSVALPACREFDPRHRVLSDRHALAVADGLTTSEKCEGPFSRGPHPEEPRRPCMLGRPRGHTGRAKGACLTLQLPRHQHSMRSRVGTWGRISSTEKSPTPTATRHDPTGQLRLVRDSIDKDRARGSVPRMALILSHLVGRVGT